MNSSLFRYRLTGVLSPVSSSEFRKQRRRKSTSSADLSTLPSTVSAETPKTSPITALTVPPPTVMSSALLSDQPLPLTLDLSRVSSHTQGPSSSGAFLLTSPHSLDLSSSLLPSTDLSSYPLMSLVSTTSSTTSTDLLLQSSSSHAFHPLHPHHVSNPSVYTDITTPTYSFLSPVQQVNLTSPEYGYFYTTQ